MYIDKHKSLQKDVTMKYEEYDIYHDFDGWEFPQCCERCKWFDNQDEKEPITFLDAETKLCADCFEYMIEKTKDASCRKCVNGCMECCGEW